MVKKLLMGLMAIMLSLPAGADQKTPLSEEEMEQRLAFITQRLNAGRTGARTWQYGWGGFFATTAAAQGYLAIQSNDSDNRANYTVGALKSTAGLAMLLLRPLPAIKGAEPIASMPAGTPQQKAARLQSAENLLRTNARRAEERTSWPRHLIAIAFNLFSGTAIAALGDVKDAAVSNLTGITISQAHIWSQPSRAIEDLDDYEREFPAAPANEEVSWQLTSIPGGLGITMRF